MFYILLTIVFIPFFIIYPCRIVGRKNIPKKGRMILAPNHQTLNDPIIIAHRLASRRRFRFMSKAPLFKKKWADKFLRSLGAYPVDNKNPNGDINAVKTTLSHLKNDRAVCIFPEGARLKTSESNQVKNGVAMFALKTNSPIIPAYFIKKTNAFVFNKLLIGKPIELYNMEEFKDKKIDKELLDKASEIIKNEIHKLYKDYLQKKQDKKLSKKHK